MTVSSLTFQKGPVTLATGTDAIATAIHILDEAHLSVTRVRNGLVSPLALTTDYTVSLVRNTAGCTVTMVGQAVGDEISIIRDIPLDQQGDYVSTFQFPPEVNEDGHDLSRMIDQQLREIIDRCLKFPEADSGINYGQEIPALLLRPGTMPVVDANGVVQWSTSNGPGLAAYGGAATKSVASATTANLVDVTVPLDKSCFVTIDLAIEGRAYGTKMTWFCSNAGGTLQFDGPLEEEFNANATGGELVTATVAINATEHRFTIDGAGLTGTRNIEARWTIRTVNNLANIPYTAL
jgi:hypothetical protein